MKLRDRILIPLSSVSSGVSRAARPGACHPQCDCLPGGLIWTDLCTSALASEDYGVPSCPLLCSNRPAPRLSPAHGGNLFLPTLLSMQLTVPVSSSFLGKLILSSNDWEYKTLALDIREFYSNDSMYFAYQIS